MPFGGRKREIDQLNAWLRDPEASGSLLLWGPAGRGKSALLVNWLAQLPMDLPRAFVPISIRADTNTPAVFYQALAARLATIVGKAISAPQFDPVNFYRERVKELLAEFTDPKRLCLLVIDGLDEATGWQVDRSILPATPPAGLKIIVSARQLAGDRADSDWLRRLGWNMRFASADSKEVEPLDRTGVADVLQRMGNPLAHLSDHEEIVDELYRLANDGDPLLLSLYVEDMIMKGETLASLRPEDLRRVRPGFSAYFENWYDEQRKAWNDAGDEVDEALTDAIFAILSCAIGPLMLVDIEEILARLPSAPRAQITLNTLRPLRRFVIGHSIPDSDLCEASPRDDGRGFVLSHPRLSEFFRKQKFAGTRLIRSVQIAFQAWGRDAAGGRLAREGDGVPRYLLHYYLQHLLNDPDAPLECYRELAEDRWQRALKAEEGGYRSFSHQMEICWSKLFAAHRGNPGLRAQPRIGLGGLIHIGLCLSSVRGIGSNAPASFIVGLVDAGYLEPDEAILIARFRTRSFDRATIIVAVAGKVQRHSAAERELLELATQMGPEPHVRTLLAIAERADADADDRTSLIVTAARIAADLDRGKDVKTLSWQVQHVALNHGIPLALLQPPDSLGTRWDLDASEVVRDAVFEEVVEAVADDDEVARSATGRQDLSLSEDALQASLVRELGKNPRPLGHETTILLQQASGGVLSRVLDALMTRNPDSLPVAAVANLASYLDPPSRRSLLERCLAELSAPFETSYPHAQIAEQVLRDLSDEEFAALEALLEPIDSYQKTRLIAAFADRLSQRTVDRLARNALIEDSRIGTDVYYIEQAAASVFPRLDAEMQSLLLRAAIGGAADDARPSLLSAISTKLGPERIDEALTAVKAAKTGDRAALLRALIHAAASMPEQRERILSACLEIEEIVQQVDLVDNLLPLLDENRRKEVLAQFRGIVLEIGDAPMVALATAALGETPDLSSAGMREWAIFQSDTRADPIAAKCLTLIAWLPHIPREVAETALAMARRRADGFVAGERIWLSLLVAACPKLTRIEADSAIRDALAMMDGGLLRDSDEQPLFAAMLLFSQHLDDSTRSDLCDRAVRGLRNPRADGDLRAILAGFLIVCPRVGWDIAAEAMAHVRQALQTQGLDKTARSALRIALDLSSMTGPDDHSASQTAMIPAEGPSVPDDSGLSETDFLNYALLGLRNDGPDTERAGAFLRRLAELDRSNALILLAAVEGHWDEPLRLRPSISKGQNNNGVLRRWGGMHAIEETVAAIRLVAKWWP